jgi:hypothetical protein
VEIYLHHARHPRYKIDEFTPLNPLHAVPLWIQYYPYLKIVYDKKKARIYKIDAVKKRKLEDDNDIIKNNIYLLAKKESIYIITTKFIDLSDTWIFNINCTNHVSCDRKAFVEYYSYSNIYTNNSKFKNISGTVLQPQKKRTVIVQILIYKKRVNVFLSNIIYYPDIRTNLISIFQLIKLGAKIILDFYKN